MGVRAIFLALCFVLASIAIGRASRSESPPPRQTFAVFPLQIGGWSGVQSPPLDERVLAQLRVDDYLVREYTAPDSRAGVGFYIGYYATQRQGETMHSPLNCLPGAGWEPVSKRDLPIDVRTTDGLAAPVRQIVVNSLVIQKGADKQAVLYWYQSHGRVVASEYWGKIYTVIDAIRMNRTDAAMVRIIAPVQGGDGSAETAAQRLCVQFAQVVFPQLDRYLPQ